MYNACIVVFENTMQWLELSIILILSGFIGFHMIRNVTHALHAPLMSITNGISSIVIIGAIYVFLNADDADLLVQILSLVAIFLASINIGGGFRISQRMLAMFRK